MAEQHKNKENFDANDNGEYFIYVFIYVKIYIYCNRCQMQLDSTQLTSAWLLAKSNSHLQKCTITYVLITEMCF